MGINAVITSFYDGIRSHYAIEFVLGEQIGSFFLHLLQVFKWFIKKSGIFAPCKGQKQYKFVLYNGHTQKNIPYKKRINYGISI